MYVLEQRYAKLTLEGKANAVGLDNLVLVHKLYATEVRITKRGIMVKVVTLEYGSSHRT